MSTGKLSAKKMYVLVRFDRSYQLIESSSKISFMQNSSRVWSADCEDWNIVWNDSVEQETDFESSCRISVRCIRFTVELDPRPINNCRSHQRWTAERWKVSCTVSGSTASSVQINFATQLIYKKYFLKYSVSRQKIINCCLTG